MPATTTRAMWRVSDGSPIDPRTKSSISCETPKEGEDKYAGKKESGVCGCARKHTCDGSGEKKYGEIITHTGPGHKSIPSPNNQTVSLKISGSRGGSFIWAQPLGWWIGGLDGWFFAKKKTTFSNVGRELISCPLFGYFSEGGTAQPTPSTQGW